MKAKVLPVNNTPKPHTCIFSQYSQDVEMGLCICSIWITWLHNQMLVM